jgi:hypothetical protein
VRAAFEGNAQCIGAFGENLALTATNDALLPLTSWLCDGDTTRCAPAASVAMHRDILLDRFTHEQHVEFTTIGKNARRHTFREMIYRLV